jgi:SAM-dependent methyltransferase
MVTVARSINPILNFETADILNLKYPDSTFGSAIAFYSIVHFDYRQVKAAFKEIKRVLAENGQFLFSFHIGDNVVHLDNFLDHQVNIDFYFFEINKIIDLLAEAGFEIIDTIERQPYRDAEYPSKRASGRIRLAANIAKAGRVIITINVIWNRGIVIYNCKCLIFYSWLF